MYSHPTEEQLARLLEPGTEDQVLALHRQIVGRTVTNVYPNPSGTTIHVAPTASFIENPLTTAGLSCHVGWNRREWYCSPNQTFGPHETTAHRTLKSAMRRARKLVDLAAPKPKQGWTNELYSKIPPIDHACASFYEVVRWEEYERDYYRDQEREQFDYRFYAQHDFS